MWSIYRVWPSACRAFYIISVSRNFLQLAVRKWVCICMSFTEYYMCKNAASLSLSLPPPVCVCISTHHVGDSSCHAMSSLFPIHTAVSYYTYFQHHFTCFHVVISFKSLAFQMLQHQQKLSTQRYIKVPCVLNFRPAPVTIKLHETETVSHCTAIRSGAFHPQQTEHVPWQQGADNNIWIVQQESNRDCEYVHTEGASYSVLQW